MKKRPKPSCTCVTQVNAQLHEKGVRLVVRSRLTSLIGIQGWNGHFCGWSGLISL